MSRCTVFTLKWSVNIFLKGAYVLTRVFWIAHPLFVSRAAWLTVTGAGREATALRCDEVSHIGVVVQQNFFSY